MERITQEINFPEAKSHTPSLKLSPLFLLVCITLIGFAIMNVVMKTLAHTVPAPSNPFTTYADVLPGQLVTVAEAIGFSCYSIAYPTEGNPFARYCYLIPAAGAFSSLNLLISEGIIRQITFIMRDNTLKVGDLELLLENAPTDVYYDSVHFSLPKHSIIVRTTAHEGQVSLFTPVWIVSFADIIP